MTLREKIKNIIPVDEFDVKDTSEYIDEILSAIREEMPPERKTRRKHESDGSITANSIFDDGYNAYRTEFLERIGV